MRNIYLLCCLLGFVLSSSKSLAQVDQCLVHLDKSFYVSGELMWFNLYLPVANRGHAFTIRVGIVDKNGASIQTFFIATEGKSQANGHYKIPYNCNSGVYQLVFIGMESSTKSPVVLAKIAVPIYNDLEKLDIVKTTAPESIQYPVYTLKDLLVEVELNKEAYQNRETVQVLVRVKDKNGNPVKGKLSVSVSDQALTGMAILPKSSFEPGLPLTANTLSNEVFTQVKLHNEAADQGQNLIAIFFPQDWKMVYTSSKQEVYTVEMPSFVGSKISSFWGIPIPPFRCNC
ncbi:MAG: Ig-like domain-containing protein [Haliscomenobacter sp.]|nr:Ig-like domain-containing protein [Haliscomenobacter sp.]MBK9491172.1 Ig-like domain-containing protein [Haliscomenobacter sp.]